MSLQNFTEKDVIKAFSAFKENHLKNWTLSYMRLKQNNTTLRLEDIDNSDIEEAIGYFIAEKNMILQIDGNVSYHSENIYSAILMQGFSWKDSIQGRDYWETLHNEFIIGDNLDLSSTDSNLIKVKLPLMRVNSLGANSFSVPEWATSEAKIVEKLSKELKVDPSHKLYVYYVFFGLKYTNKSICTMYANRGEEPKSSSIANTSSMSKSFIKIKPKSYQSKIGLYIGEGCRAIYRISRSNNKDLPYSDEAKKGFELYKKYTS